MFKPSRICKIYTRALVATHTDTQTQPSKQRQRQKARTKAEPKNRTRLKAGSVPHKQRGPLASNKCPRVAPTLQSGPQSPNPPSPLQPQIPTPIRIPTRIRVRRHAHVTPLPSGALSISAVSLARRAPRPSPLGSPREAVDLAPRRERRTSLLGARVKRCEARGVVESWGRAGLADGG